MKLDVSESIARPPADVFRFVATNHVENHPRWDPRMSLEPVTSGPIGVGTRIRRSYVQGETPVEGEMEVTEYQPDRTMAAVIRDGPMELRSAMIVDPEGEGGSRLTFTIEADMALEAMEEPVRGSLRRIKEMLEAGE